MISSHSSSPPDETVRYVVLAGEGIPGLAGGTVGGGAVCEWKKGLLVELVDGAGLEDAGTPPPFITRLNRLLRGFSTGGASGGGVGGEGAGGAGGISSSQAETGGEGGIRGVGTTGAQEM